MMKIFDTHAHYDSEQFDPDRDDILVKIHKADECCSVNKNQVPVLRVINVGADMASSRLSVALSHKYDFIYAAVGVHPDSAGELIHLADPPEGQKAFGISECAGNRNELKELAKEPKVSAIGEIGLDYHWDVWPREVQKEAFRMQWELALELNLPVIIHSRDAAEDTMNIIREFYKKTFPGGIKEQGVPKSCQEPEFSRDGVPKPGLKAVMHCYSYSVEQAEEYLKMGLMFGIGGVVTFKNARKLKEVVDLIPLDRILLETDSPYMAPEPFRGKRNNSGYLCYVAEKIAEIKGIEVGEVYSATYKNAETFFGADILK